MPQILVVTDPLEKAASTVVYRERISLSDLESEHFSGQLVERVGWAMLDADQLEHRVAIGRARRVRSAAESGGAGSSSG
jgi:hypothetical protein